MVIPSSPTCQGISDLEKVLIKPDLVNTYSYVHLLFILIMILPVATTTMEKAFSSMKRIKNEERNSIGDQYLNGYLVCYIKHDVFINVINDVIIDRFQNMKIHRGKL